MMILRNTDTSVNGHESDTFDDWSDSYRQEDYFRRGRQVEPPPSYEPDLDVYEPSWDGEDEWTSEGTP